MIDICKCSGEKCKVKKQCKRYTAKEKKYQSWGNFYLSPKKIDGKCGMFMENKK